MKKVLFVFVFSMPQLKLNTLFLKLIRVHTSPKTTLVQTNFTYANVVASTALVRDFSTFITKGNTRGRVWRDGARIYS